MMKSVLFLLVVAAVLGSALASGPFTVCSDKSNGLWTVDSVSSTTPTKGESVKITVKGTLSETVTGGNNEFIAYFGILKVADENVDLCEQDYKPCPWEAGPLEITFDTFLNSSIPSGSWKIREDLTTTSGQGIVCLEGSFKL